MRVNSLRRGVMGTMVWVLAALARAQVPEGVTHAPVPIVAPLDAATLRDAAELLDEAAPPPRELTWTGTVTGPDLEPLQGADVWFYPDGVMLAASGHAPQLAPDSGGLGWHRPELLEALS